jgi:hypothetical protein
LSLYFDLKYTYTVAHLPFYEVCLSHTIQLLPDDLPDGTWQYIQHALMNAINVHIENSGLYQIRMRNWDGGAGRTKTKCAKRVSDADSDEDRGEWSVLRR